MADATSPIPTTTTFKVVSRNKASKSTWRKTLSWSVILTALFSITIATIVKVDAENDSNFPSYLVYVVMDAVGMSLLIQQEWLWLVGGAALGLLVFETSQGHRHRDNSQSQHQSAYDTELCVTICPLGIQRSFCSKGTPMKYHPLLPTAAVKDCIVTEHVGAFCVTTHVMFRVYTPVKVDDKKEKDDDNHQSSTPISLIETFPNASLTFQQCHSLRNQIQAALNDIK